ncbi:hypothetical protein HMPREF1162_1025 [ [[Propionibacterium] namnetense SK182B-JCVI]|uniref:Uncharacterized protein n=1 Tax=[Propionibacterium] namnetense SK182B-JCVI TaxID=1051006 RepID=F9NXM6_9ACTN|nr:hypothetical protein HMPREF1162_1025 [ [[Propionibacterium] namnetense SK182B-JCVI]
MSDAMAGAVIKDVPVIAVIPVTAKVPAMANTLSFLVLVMPCSFACGVDASYCPLR